MGRHSVGDERVFWRSFGLTLLKWVGVATLPVLAAFGIWRLIAGDDTQPESPRPSAAAIVSPSPTQQSPPPEPSPAASPAPAVSASPSSTKGELQVLNATGVPGTGVQAAKRLEEAGYTVVATQNASRRYSKTTVFYQPGFKQMAEAVAKVLSVGSVQPALDNLDKKIPVTAVIGDDYKA